MRDDQVHLQFGKPHPQAWVPPQTPTGIAIWNFLVFGASREVTRRIPLLRIGVDGRILVGIAEMVGLMGKQVLAGEAETDLAAWDG